MMKRPVIALGALAAGLALLVPAAALAGGKHGHGKHHSHKKNPMACVELAAWVMDDDHKVLQATSEVVPAAGNTPSYCVVNLTRYHAVNIRVGLPLNSVDGGTGGEEGAWNGRIQNQGGGGHAGSVGGVTGPVSNGFVGSSTDTGHSRDWCNAINPDTGEPNSLPNCGDGGVGFVLDPDYNLYKYQVKDFIKDSIYHQTTKAIDLSKAYYGQKHKLNYWTGCSTGGRQGLEMAMSHGELFDGIVAGSPAINWNRFYIGEQLWTYVVRSEILGGAPLPNSKVSAANAAAVAACDANDGVTDGFINQPRRCDFDAAEISCSADPGNPNCLTDEEAEAINLLWEGPRDSKGRRLWGGVMRGAPVGGGPVLTARSNYWARQDPAWTPDLINFDNYEAEFTHTNDKFQYWASSDSTDLDKVRKNGGKIIYYHGLHDSAIYPVGTLEYASRLLDRYGSKKSQKFVRGFFYPGAGHCGGAGMNGGQLFDVLQDWVENDVEPDEIVISRSAGSTTKVCMYPNETVYKGGDVNDAASYECRVNKKEPKDLARWADFAPRLGDGGKKHNHGHDHKHHKHGNKHHR